MLSEPGCEQWVPAAAVSIVRPARSSALNGAWDLVPQYVVSVLGEHFYLGYFLFVCLFS